MSSIKIKWQHLSNVPLLPLAVAPVPQRCRCSNLHTMSCWNTKGIFMCLLWLHIIMALEAFKRARHVQEQFCTEKGPVLFYSSMWMIFINEALFTVCFLRVLRVLVTVFALGLLKQLSLCSVLRPRKGGETWTLSPGLGLPRGLDQTFCILNKEGFLCSTICDVCGLWFIDNKSLCSGPQLLLQNTG